MGKKRKLIERSELIDVVCDKQGCDFMMPIEEKSMHLVINARCPKCGENVLTLSDYITYLKLIRRVNFINKWFSWITIFKREPNNTHVYRAHTHNGVKFEKAEGGGYGKETEEKN